MRKFSELSGLTIDQEEFVDRYMYQWGAWVRSGRLDKPQLNIIAKLMQSVIPAEPNEPICDDETGFMIKDECHLTLLSFDVSITAALCSKHTNHDLIQ